MKPRLIIHRFVSVLALFAGFAAPLRAWDYEGHRIVNQLALASLPAEFPAFVREPANAERIAFLAGEPDRWRNVPDPVMRQSGGSWADHYCDLEQIPQAGLDYGRLPSLRYDFILQFAAGRAAHLDRFPAIEPEKNTDHTREWPGFAPWAITEYCARLKSAFAYLKVFEELGTPEEIANARENIVYVMGVMGHYVGDCAQPLHTTIHHNGWVGDNPNGYTTWAGVHSWIDGGFITKAGITYGAVVPRIAPARPISLAARADGRDPMFAAVMDYILAQNKQVESLYQLEKAGKFSDELEKAGKFNQDKAPVNEEGRAFIEAQLLKGGEMLGALWLTAWRDAPPDTFLRGTLIRRKSAAMSKGAP
jgi:hypothetical protein